MIGKHTLNIGDKAIQLRFSMWSMRMACKEMGTSLDVLLETLGQIDGTTDTFKALDFIASMLANAANTAQSNNAAPNTMREGYEWIEEVGMGSVALQAAMTAMVESIGSIMGTANAATEPTDGAKKNELPLTLSN